MFDLPRRMGLKRSIVSLVPLIIGLLTPEAAAAHIVIDPIDSPAGATQLYHIAVPSEKRADTIRVEVQFPRALVVLQLQAPAGWRVTPQTDGAGRVLGAVWEGGAAPSAEFLEVGVLAQNPRNSGDLTWSVIQTYSDQSEVQWFGPENAQFPASVTHVRQSGIELSPADVLAAAALVLSIVAVSIALWTHAERLRRVVEDEADASQASAGASAPRRPETVIAQPPGARTR